MDLIDQIAPVAGGVALLGLAVLAFLIFQQGREIRRLREWAGRAPERAIDAAVASLAASEARLRSEAESGNAESSDYLANSRRRRRSRTGARIVVGLLVAAAIGSAVVLTDGFGFLGEGGGNEATEQPTKKKKPALPRPGDVRVAVLNATNSPASPAVAGLAGSVTEQIVKPLGYRVVIEADATSGRPSTAIMFSGDDQRLAKRFAKQVSGTFGEIDVARMNSQVQDDAAGADLALVIGLDRADFGQ